MINIGELEVNVKKPQFLNHLSISSLAWGVLNVKSVFFHFCRLLCKLFSWRKQLKIRWMKKIKIKRQ